MSIPSHMYLYSVPEHDAIKFGHARNPSSSARNYSNSYGFRMPSDIRSWSVSSKDIARLVEDKARKNLLQAVPTRRVELRGHNALAKAKGTSRKNEVCISQELLVCPRGLALDHFEDLCGYVIENLLFHHGEWGISLDKSQPGLKEKVVGLVASLHDRGDAGKFLARLLFSV
jgi:hypothetical protein